MNFYQKVYRLVRRIPRGKVLTYGQVAAMISSPRAARVVGYALRALPGHTDIPWQRVINKEGRISIENLQWPKELQAKLLKKEGIKVEQRDGNWYIDLEKYTWKV